MDTEDRTEEPDCKWQRRILDRPFDDDFTKQAVGDEVVVETAKLAACPGCKRPGIAVGLPTDYGVAAMIIHKRDKAGGQPTEVCVATPHDRPDLVMLDAEGNEQYAGPAEIPEDKKN